MTTLSHRPLVGAVLALAGLLARGEDVDRVIISPRGEIRIERANGTCEGSFRLTGGDFVVRKVVWSPDRSEVTILADDITHLDWASRVFSFDPETGSLRVLLDTYGDRWGGRRLLLDAAVRAGRPKDRYPDNDLTDLFYDADGALHVTNEDGDTFAATVCDGVVTGLRLVGEWTQSPGPVADWAKVRCEPSSRFAPERR